MAIHPILHTNFDWIAIADEEGTPHPNYRRPPGLWTKAKQFWADSIWPSRLVICQLVYIDRHYPIDPSQESGIIFWRIVNLVCNLYNISEKTLPKCSALKIVPFLPWTGKKLIFTKDQGGTRSYEGHKLGERVFQFTWRTLKAKCKWEKVRKKHIFPHHITNI